MSASNTMSHAHHDAHAHDHGHHDAGANSVFGFWIYLMSDCLIFAGLFATYAVLSGATVDGPTAKELFDLKFVLVETFLLLFSSLTFGLAMIGAHKGSKGQLLGGCSSPSCSVPASSGWSSTSSTT